MPREGIIQVFTKNEQGNLVFFLITKLKPGPTPLKKRLIDCWNALFTNRVMDVNTNDFTLKISETEAKFTVYCKLSLSALEIIMLYLLCTKPVISVKS